MHRGFRHLSQEPVDCLPVGISLGLVARRKHVLAATIGLMFFLPLANSFGLTDDQATSGAPRGNDAATIHLSIVDCARCHGSFDFLDSENAQDRWRSAYQVWVSRDPHSDAYLTLWNKQSQSIVTALACVADPSLSADEDFVDEASYQEIVNQRCISCHSTVPAGMSTEMNVGESSFNPNLSMSNGVSCLSCHGASELDDPNGKDWIEAHTKRPWTEFSRDEKTRLGLQELTRLDVRARTCTKCHIGSPGRDVNHDLIAAGHPRLVFEYSSSLMRLPRHWTEEKAVYFHSTSWSIGQIESARSSLALLRQRALLSEKGGPWPEFAEYNCFSCHHGLGGNWYRPHQGPGFGQPDWSIWVFPWDVATPATRSDFSALRIEMEQPIPDADNVAQTASTILQALQDQSPIENLYEFVENQPSLTSDEVLAWYLAVNCCIRDSSFDRESGAIVNGLMLELKTMLEQPFADSQNKRPVGAAEMIQKMSQIRQIVLPVLEAQRNTPKRQP